MASLELLPVELILEICSHLHKDLSLEEGPQNLSRLSRTNPHLRAIAQPLLFTSFNYKNPSISRLSNLLRVLDLRPDLAHHFRHFKVQYTSNIWCCNWDRISREDTHLVNSHVVNLGLPALEWRHDRLPLFYVAEMYGAPWEMRCPIHLLLVELVVTRIAPTLTFLSLPMDSRRWQMPTISRHRTLMSSSSESEFFPRLSILEITQLHDDYGSDLDTLSDIGLFVPSLREFWTFTPIIHLPPEHNIPKPSKRYPDMMFIRRLELKGNVLVRVRVVHVMLGSMPSLEVLGLSSESRRSNEAGELWDAIAQCKGTLRELRVDTWLNLEDSTELKVEEMRELYSLEGFEQLEVLNIGREMLWALCLAWEREFSRRDRDGFLEGMFPESIREVTFWEPSMEFRAGMVRLAWAVTMGRCPRLKRVVMSRPEIVTPSHWDENRDGFWEVERLGLKEAFERAGLKFVMDLKSKGCPPEPADSNLHF